MYCKPQLVLENPTSLTCTTLELVPIHPAPVSALIPTYLRTFGCMLFIDYHFSITNSEVQIWLKPLLVLGHNHHASLGRVLVRSQVETLLDHYFERVLPDCSPNDRRRFYQAVLSVTRRTPAQFLSLLLRSRPSPPPTPPPN